MHQPTAGSVAAMQMFMDIHDIGEATPEDLARAHLRDLEVQDKYGVRFLTYWLNESGRHTFCLVEAPDAETAIACHKEAHGLLPSRMIEVEPGTLTEYLGGWEKSVPDRATLDGPGSPPDSGIRAVVFTDIVGSTEISASRGDDEALDAVRVHNTIVRDALAAFDGQEVKHTGDGILASFVSPSRAVTCTIDIQRGFADQGSLRVRIGVSAGEPLAEEGDLFGAVVNLASRLCSHAEPSEIVVSRAVRDLLLGKEFEFVDRGGADLRGFDHPVHVYSVDWRA